MNSWTLGKDNKILFKGVEFTLKEVIEELNNADDEKMEHLNQIKQYEKDLEKAQKETLFNIRKYEKKLERQSEIINGLEDKLNKEKEISEAGIRRIEELETMKNEFKDFPKADYWKGIERTYLKILDDYLDRITALELEKWYYEVENDELKEKLLKEGGMADEV